MVPETVKAFGTEGSPDRLQNLLSTRNATDPYPQDVWCEVKDKLIAVTDLFNFYDSLEFYDKPISMRKRTVGEAVRIIDDCIDKLDTLFQK